MGYADTGMSWQAGSQQVRTVAEGRRALIAGPTKETDIETDHTWDRRIDRLMLTLQRP